mmetsp:Transcript_21124/g.68140  ORF Transcript_21124/g.68140 Transcript_21124/m.68140 type:complete len:200 (-) Transcript_21124:243-842(-)
MLKLRTTVHWAGMITPEWRYFLPFLRRRASLISGISAPTSVVSCRTEVVVLPMKSCLPDLFQSQHSSRNTRSRSPLHSVCTPISASEKVGFSVFLITSLSHTSTSAPSSRMRTKRRNGSLLPKKSFLSKPRQTNWICSTSLQPWTSSARISSVPLYARPSRCCSGRDTRPRRPMTCASVVSTVPAKSWSSSRLLELSRS